MSRSVKPHAVRLKGVFAAVAAAMAAAGCAFAQMSVTVGVGNDLSLCDTARVTNRLVNIGTTLGGLLVTNELPGEYFVYVPGETIISLPDGTVLTNGAADPVISPDQTRLSWDFSTVSGTGGVNHALISEIFYWATNSADFDVAKMYQWFELFNPTPAPVTLSGAFVRDAQPGQSDLLPEIAIGPGQFAVVAASTNRFLINNPGYTNALYEITDPGSNGIGNGLNFYMDGVGLYDSSSNLVDGASYGGSTVYLNPAFPQVSAGHSMARYPANRDTGTQSDWTDLAAPTPGAGTIQTGINNGDVIEISYLLEIECGATPGTIRSVAVFQQPPGSANSTNTGSALINPREAALIVEKTPLLQSRKYLEEFTWTLTVRNEGFGKASNVRLRDSAGLGIELMGFSAPPTNEVIGQVVEWDQTVLPALASIDVAGQVSIVVTGRAVACSGLYNDGDAAWGCEGFVAATDSTCNDTAWNEGTARATIDFISESPVLSGWITPDDPAPVDYCSGSDIAIVVTNAHDAGPARNIELIPTLPGGFGLSGPAITSSNTVDIGDLEPGGVTNVVVTIAPTNCPVPLERQDLLLQSRYEDLCGTPFSALGLFTSFQVVNPPGASIFKTMPEELYGGSSPVTASVKIVFAYTNFSGTAITIQDTYPRDPSNLLQVANVDPVALDDGTNLTWVMALSGSGVATARFDLVVSSPVEQQCLAPDSYLENILTAPDYVDCNYCFQPVLGSGQSYPFAFFPAPCGGSGTGGCYYAGVKTPAAELVEACSPAVNTHRFTFSGSLVPTGNWDGVVFHSDLGGGAVDTNAVMVYAGTSNVTAYAAFDQTDPELRISFSALTNTQFFAPSTLTNSYLEIVWAASVTNIGRVADYSWLTLPGCSGRGAFSRWTQGESVLGVSMNSVTNRDACGISTICVSLTNLPSPNLPAWSSAPFPAYDARLIVDLDTDNDLAVSFDYVSNSTVFADMLDETGAPIAAFEPLVQTNTLVWDIGDLASNGAGSVYFNLRSSCSLSGMDLHKAELQYNTRCHALESGRVRFAESATNTVPFLFNASLFITLQPEHMFLTSTQYPARIEVRNTGAGAAYNVRPELVIPTNIRFGAASVAPLSVSATNAIWGGFAPGLGDLADIDGDGEADDLMPNGAFVIWVTNHVVNCAAQAILARVSQGCKDEYCETPPDVQADFITAAGQVVTDIQFPVDLVVCSNGTASYSIRNAGIVDVMDVAMKLALPTGITYMAGSSRYVFEGQTNATSDPSGDGSLANPLVWTQSQAPPLATLSPTQTVELAFDFPIACESAFGSGLFTMTSEYTDICGRTNLTKQALVSATLHEPELSVAIAAGTNTAGFSPASFPAIRASR